MASYIFAAFMAAWICLKVPRSAGQVLESACRQPSNAVGSDCKQFRHADFAMGY